MSSTRVGLLLLLLLKARERRADARCNADADRMMTTELRRLRCHKRNRKAVTDSIVTTNKQIYAPDLTRHTTKVQIALARQA